MGVADTDLIAYCAWARNVRGLADTTLRVRWDVLSRLHDYIGKPLREAHDGNLLDFERVAIAGKSAETRRSYACHIRALYRWMVKTGVITSDPSTLLTLPKVPRHLPRPIAEDDLARAMQTARPKMRVMLTLASYAGLRCVEIAGLDWEDLHRDGPETVLHVRSAKGGNERMVQVGETVMQALRGYGIKRRGPMFIGQDGRKMTADSVSRVGNAYLKRNDIPATMHQLRHRFGTVAYQVSRDIRMVGDMMGHRSPTTTAIYTRPSAEAASRMVAAMDELANPA